MRRRPGLAGYVITEFTDAHWEANGLLDMKRNPRDLPRRLPQGERRHRGRAALGAPVLLVGGDHEDRPLDRAWRGCGAGRGCAGDHHRRQALPSHAVPALQSGDIADLGVIEVPLPATSEPRSLRVEFSFKDREGVAIASNHLDVALHALPEQDDQVFDVIHAPDPQVREHLADLGYEVSDTMDGCDMVVAAEFDKLLVNFVRNGGKLLYLPSKETTLYPFFPHWQNVRVVERAGTLWAGDWASTFAWLRRSGPFGRFPGGPLLDETFDRVLPTHLMNGINLLDFQGRVHAGIVIGWIHKPAAYVVERAYGNGRMVASTFRLFRDPPGCGPDRHSSDGCARGTGGRIPHGTIRRGRASRGSSCVKERPFQTKSGASDRAAYSLKPEVAIPPPPSWRPPTNPPHYHGSSGREHIKRRHQNAAFGGERRIQNRQIAKIRDTLGLETRTRRSLSRQFAPGHPSAIGHVPDARAAVDQEVEGACTRSGT